MSGPPLRSGCLGRFQTPGARGLVRRAWGRVTGYCAGRPGGGVTPTGVASGSERGTACRRGTQSTRLGPPHPRHPARHGRPRERGPAAQPDAPRCATGERPIHRWAAPPGRRVRRAAVTSGGSGGTGQRQDTARLSAGGNQVPAQDGLRAAARRRGHVGRAAAQNHAHDARNLAPTKPATSHPLRPARHGRPQEQTPSRSRTPHARPPDDESAATPPRPGSHPQDRPLRLGRQPGSRSGRTPRRCPPQGARRPRGCSGQSIVAVRGSGTTHRGRVAPMRERSAQDGVRAAAASNLLTSSEQIVRAAPTVVRTSRSAGV